MLISMKQTNLEATCGDDDQTYVELPLEDAKKG